MHFVVELYGHGRCGESDHASSVAELPHGKEGRGLQGSRNNVHPSGGQEKAGEVKFSLMGRVHNGAVRVGDAERPQSDTIVDDRAVTVQK
jgi:hypothetical protein